MNLKKYIPEGKPFLIQIGEFHSNNHFISQDTTLIGYYRDTAKSGQWMIVKINEKQWLKLVYETDDSYILIHGDKSKSPLIVSKKSDKNDVRFVGVITGAINPISELL